MELNFAAGDGAEGGGGEAGNLAQEFFQGLLCSAVMPGAAGSVSLRSFWARRVPEAAGRRKLISPWTAPPATTVYHTSESVTGGD
jgi:hypothetical protein